MPRPSGTATGNDAILPFVPSRASRTRNAACVPISSVPPSPVTAKRQPDWRSRPRAIASPGADGSERVEITGGLQPQDKVVASGGGFLADGDLVRVVDAPPAPAAAPNGKQAAAGQGGNTATK